MKVKDSNIDVPEITHVAYQDMKGKLDLRFIGHKIDDVETYLKNGWEVYQYRLVSHLSKK